MGPPVAETLTVTYDHACLPCLGPSPRCPWYGLRGHWWVPDICADTGVRVGVRIVFAHSATSPTLTVMGVRCDRGSADERKRARSMSVRSLKRAHSPAPIRTSRRAPWACGRPRLRACACARDRVYPRPRARTNMRVPTRPAARTGDLVKRR